MDFFNQEAHAQKQTRRLLCLFTLAVSAVVVLNCLVLTVLVWAFQHPPVPQAWWNPVAMLVTIIFTFGEALFRPVHFFGIIADPLLCGGVATGTIMLIAAGCLYKWRQLSGGGPAVAELLGGRKIETSTTDPDEKRLRDVVEEMAVAAGLPVPEIYVLDCERGINSFAAGHTREDLAIGMTFGALKLLTRDELQGVAAHEFSHILNGDTQLNMKLMVLAHGLFWPTIAGRVLIFGTPQAPPEGESLFDAESSPTYLPTAPLGFLFLFVGSISSPFVRLIKSSICREREWLADSAAVQFTRNPPGITGAFKKIGGLLKQGRLDTPKAEIASHLYFSNSSFDPWFSFMSTHPPLGKRILAIDPAFDGQFQHIHSLPRPEIEEAARYDHVYEESLRRAREQAKAREASE